MAVLGKVELVVLQSETISMNNDVTDRAVEKDSNIADHIRHQPIALALQCVIGNLPNDPQLAERTYQQLKQMRDSEDIFTYVGHLDKFDNMAIVSMSPMREVSTSDSFVVSIQLKQITIAQAQVIPMPPKATAKTQKELKSVKKPTEKGRRNPKVRKTGGVPVNGTFHGGGGKFRGEMGTSASW